MTAGLRVRTEQGVCVIELDRPDRHNALTAAMIDGLASAFRDAARTPDVSLVVLRGAGIDLCTGVDLDEFYATADSAVPGQEREAARACRCWARWSSAGASWNRRRWWP